MPARRVAAVAVLLAACSPALDWREVRVDGAEALMPCRPRPATRQLALAGRPVAMTLQACDAAGRTWAIASADVVDAARVGPALAALREAAAANVGAASGVIRPLRVRGALAEPPVGRLQFDGRLDDGRPVRSEVALFAAGTRVYQATVLEAGRAHGADAGAETFFGSLAVVR